MSVDRVSRISTVLGRGAVAAELLVLLLWIPDNGLGHLLHEEATRPATATAYLLLGLALSRRWRPVVRAGLLGTAAVIAVEALLVNLTGHSLLSDGLLYPARWRDEAPHGQMSPASSVTVLLVAAGLVVSRRRPLLGSVLGSAAFGIAFASMVGHAYGASMLTDWQSVTQMAMPTVPIAFAVAIGMLLEHPALPAHRAFRAEGTTGRLVRGSLLGALVGPFVVGWMTVIGGHAGLFDSAYGESITVLVLTAGAIGAVMVGARTAVRADRHAAAAADRERLQYLLDGTPVGIFETDAHGHRTYVNLRWRELTGVLEDIAGDDWTRVLHPADRERVETEWAAAIDRGEPYAGRYRYLHRDGGVRWVDTTTTAIRAADGTVSRWLGSVTDVTEQVEAAQQLRSSERRYRSVVATMAEGVVLHDADGAVVTANQAASVILGIELTDMTGRNPTGALGRMVREDGTELAEHELPSQVALATGKPVRDATIGLHRLDGSLAWLEVNVEPLLDAGPDGMPTVTGVVSTFADVTESRAAAKALARSEELFRSAMEHAPVGMALVALDGSMIEVNHALARLVGYEESELVGRTFQEITHPEDLEADLDNLTLLRSGAIDHYTLEKRYLSRDGDVVWGLLAVSMARDEQDEPAYYVAQVQDVTAARAAQERLEHQALHDPLTGLANRDLLMDRLAHALARSTRSGSRTLVMFCDLDHFKDVNDTLGHETGDYVLMTLADRLRGAVRPGDTVARLGGDEFVVVAESVSSPEQQRAMAARVQAVLDQPVLVGDGEVRTGASIGVAVAGPDADVRSVLREADAAMYRAKARGRGRYEMSHESSVSTLQAT